MVDAKVAGTSPCRCSRTPSSPAPPARPRIKRGPDPCRQRFASPRTYADYGIVKMTVQRTIGGNQGKGDRET